MLSFSSRQADFCHFVSSTYFWFHFVTQIYSCVFLGFKTLISHIYIMAWTILRPLLAGQHLAEDPAGGYIPELKCTDISSESFLQLNVLPFIVLVLNECN